MYLQVVPDFNLLCDQRYVPRETIYIQDCLGKVAKVLEAPYLCLHCMVGLDRVQAVREHVRKVHTEWANQVARVSRTQMMRQKERTVQRDADQRIHNASHPNCQCPSCNFHVIEDEPLFAIDD